MRPKKPRDSERGDRRGGGESFPRAPPGLSRSDWGDCLKSIITTSEDWKFVVAPAVGYGLFCSRRDFSDSLGGGIWVTKEGDAIFAPPSFVVPVGHDPTTPWLWVRCSNQLSYGTRCRPTRFDGRHVKVTKLFEKDKTLWISLQNLRQHVFVKCKKMTFITLNLQYIDAQGDSMCSNLSVDATYFFDISTDALIIIKLSKFWKILISNE